MTRRERLVLHRLSPHMQRTRPSARFVIVFVRTRAVARKRIGAARFHRITGGVRERSSWSVERARALFVFVSSHSPSRLLVEHPLDSVHPARVVHVGVPELLEERLRLGSAYTLLSETTTGAFLSAGSFAGSTNPMFRVSQVALTAPFGDGLSATSPGPSTPRTSRSVAFSRPRSVASSEKPAMCVSNAREDVRVDGWERRVSEGCRC